MDGLCVRGGINGLMGPAITVSGGPDRPNTGPTQLPAAGRAAATTNALSTKFSGFNYPFIKSLFSVGGGGSKTQRSNKGVAMNDAVLIEERENEAGEFEGQNGNWILKILHVRSLWEEEERGSGKGQDGNFTTSTSSSSCSCDGDDDDDVCDGCRVMDDDDEEEFDRESFTKMLKKVSLTQSKLYAKLSYLGNLAYDIPNIKRRNLLKRHRLRYVTSSIQKTEQLAEKEKKEQLANATTENQEDKQLETKAKDDDQNTNVRASAAYQIAFNAASYLHSRTRAILPSGSSKGEEDHEKLTRDDGSLKNRDINSEIASLKATTDSVTAVVAAKEEVKQAVADDLNSISSSPCEWFVCDDDKSATRFFVIQGSETLASWQANLLFEPMQFEGLDVFVHRGIYEAAKGMYQQMLPEVQTYMKTHGSRAKFRFTGHSLGGSLSMLINLMLLIRGEVPYASLLPVITFGSPCVMCGGDDLLRNLELPKSHVQAIVMHRDIVPRAFSCNYPMPAAQLLKAVNGSFRNLPCLNSQKLLYAPMGEMLILQPDANFSPEHDLLPSGSGLYLLVTSKARDAKEAEKQLRAAKNTFLNTPHPLEILSDRSAYGNGGAIQRDHDMNSYLKCIRGVIRHELSRVRKAERERRRKVWWPIIKPCIIETGVVLDSTLGPSRVGGSARFDFVGALRTGSESVKRFSRLVASQHMHLLVVLLFPARLLLIGASNIIPR